jgi:histidinol-phosphate phosphatase family protein
MKAVLLDRDGTIIEDADYPRDPNLVAWAPNALEGLSLMVKKGYRLFVVSNQSGVGRGIIKHEEFDAVHARFARLLVEAKIPIAGFGYCLHAPKENCACRKPKPGLVPQGIDPNSSFVVGDKVSDLELADAIGATGYLVLTGKGKASRDELKAKRYQIFPDLLAVALTLP